MTVARSLSFAEQKAEQTQALPAFEQINLRGIRSDVEEILRQIGAAGAFREYTVHDIRHIDALLAILEWIVPEPTARSMTPVDWLLIVFAIYFHDLGMVVTKDEFEARFRSDFPQYRARVLSDEAEPEYRAKIAKLQPEEQEIFLYQEFVRENHPARIRAWIMGAPLRIIGTGEYRFWRGGPLSRPAAAHISQGLGAHL